MKERVRGSKKEISKEREWRGVRTGNAKGRGIQN